ncbi:hypothetical protein [Neobacillus bataviensis]|uniref:hypothetical protein n=1 Tax=Neobacillus bataviensis TaxID=220685 RepID=UPI001CC12FE3|nr:hypothetical protein [Neobacillus bataviensis]
MLTEADASRTDGFITVKLIGQLPTRCDEIVELGHYPGTGISSARIFLREGRKPGLEDMYCIQGLGKIWSINRVILDKFSTTVEIFINNHLVRKIRVIEASGHGWYNIH